MSAPARDRVYRILHLEDSEPDHEVLVAHLLRGGMNAQARRIESEIEFLEALDEPWDVVVSDYNLPGFSGLVALELLKASMREIPFILVSGEIGDDTAVEAMRNGANDYLQKSNLARLVPALLHAIDAAETRRARIKADRDLIASKQRLHELAQHLQTSVEHERDEPGEAGQVVVRDDRVPRLVERLEECDLRLDPPCLRVHSAAQQVRDEHLVVGLRILEMEDAVDAVAGQRGHNGAVCRPETTRRLSRRSRAHVQ